MMKGYLPVLETSYRWGVSERRIKQNCTQGHIPGVLRFGRLWCIKANAERPTDPRKSKSCERGNEHERG